VAEAIFLEKLFIGVRDHLIDWALVNGPVTIVTT
jgi:hypothetical protein